MKEQYIENMFLNLFIHGENKEKNTVDICSTQSKNEIFLSNIDRGQAESLIKHHKKVMRFILEFNDKLPASFEYLFYKGGYME